MPVRTEHDDLLDWLVAVLPMLDPQETDCMARAMVDQLGGRAHEVTRIDARRVSSLVSPDEADAVINAWFGCADIVGKHHDSADRHPTYTASQRTCLKERMWTESNIRLVLKQRFNPQSDEGAKIIGDMARCVFSP